ncbi:hypothetical protein EXU48_13835 [Occultella glacieicola]|uniref:Uncharacterized protein n=1 Tax=Occultella glacieicola TaxID=2518684 RepID=A0ABY2E422_9MICO|nr:hypothetical protein [Occultella glacieicola]TDE92618.1 hypothetical protein EXU48_13835 [Occultella glacieicola]
MSKARPACRREHLPGTLTSYGPGGTEIHERYCSCGHRLPWREWEAEYEAHLVADGAAEALSEMSTALRGLRDEVGGSSDFGRGVSAGLCAALEAIEAARRRLNGDQAA